VHGPKSLEVWNLVFTQFDRQPDGSLAPLPRKNIDTGMGLERLARVVQAVDTDYETDLFTPILRAIRSQPRGTRAKPNQALFAERAIADHLRAIVFLVAEGLRPSNESRGYVLRMLIRRAHRLGRVGLDLNVGVKKTFLSSLIGSVEEAMQGSPYSAELAKERDVIRRTVEQEEEQFVGTLEAGTARLDELLRSAKGKVIAGEDAFRLYDTYGFPLELTLDIAQERGAGVDRAGFERALKAQQERSRSASQFSGGVFATEALQVRAAVPGMPPKAAQFVGYDSLTSDATLKGIWDGARWVPSAAAGAAVGLVLDRSPFYGEAGGQIGDAGRIEGPKGRAEVSQTSWADDVLVHHAMVREGTLSVHEPVRASVDADRRLKVARSHTAAHMLHWALRRVLGPEAVQAGSYVEAERVRFDFSSLQGLRDEQRFEVEALVNSRVRLADEIGAKEMRLDEARRDGALALFGEKYGGTVRVVTIGDYSKELCGGTHLRHTGLVGGFLIAGESSIAAGTRRIEALVGESAAQKQQEGQRLLQEAARRLSRPAHELVAGLEELLEEIKRLERDRKSLQERLARFEAHRLVAEGKRINGVTLVTSTSERTDREQLAILADAVRGSLQRDGIVLLASAEASDKVALVMATTSDVAGRVHAGQILKAVSPLTKGSGGGRPEFAQAGGKDPAGIPAAMKRAEELIREALEKP
jgi:alanyl-tRNA synthetase